MSKITIIKLVALALCNGMSVTSPNPEILATIDFLTWGGIEIVSGRKERKSEEESKKENKQ